MGAMADLIEAIHVHAELRGSAGIDVYCSSGFYQQTSEHELERRLTALARLLWTERERAYRQAVAEFVFLAGLRQAAARMIDDQARQMIQLKGQVYG
jgi:hypothetical protein